MNFNNLDLVSQKKDEIMQKMQAAMTEGNEESFAQSFTEFAEFLQSAVMAEAAQMVERAEDALQSVDATVLASRGVRQLTSKEVEFYQKTIEAMKSTAPKQALANLDVVMPETVIDAVFEDLQSEHELLSIIDFQNTSGVVKFLLNTHDNQLAAWGPLNSEIVKELTSGFKLVDMTLNKLSAFIPVAKDMLDLGPAWLDKYVRAILAEAIAFGLEEAIINGTGKDMPIGMNRQVGDDVTITGGVYPLKTAVPVTSLEPVAYGSLLASLSTFVKHFEAGENDDPDTVIYGTRVVKEVVMIVNPTDYLTKIMPATTVRGTDGTYRSDVLPFPTRIVQSTAVAEGEMIVGLNKRYFMGVGTGKQAKIEYSDEYRFLEDERVYLTKLHAHGQARDNNAFIRCDISGLEPANVAVKVVNAEDFIPEEIEG